MYITNVCRRKLSELDVIKSIKKNSGSFDIWKHITILYSPGLFSHLTRCVGLKIGWNIRHYLYTNTHTNSQPEDIYARDVYMRSSYIWLIIRWSSFLQYHHCLIRFYIIFIVVFPKKFPWINCIIVRFDLRAWISLIDSHYFDMPNKHTYVSTVNFVDCQ